MSQIIRVGLKDGKKYHILGICDEAIIMNRYIKKNSDAIKKEVVRLEETYPEAVVVVGYEYTLLVRVWDELDYSPQIINIPFNEYIFGSFNLELIDHHYYSIFIPEEADEIITNDKAGNQ